MITLATRVSNQNDSEMADVAYYLGAVYTAGLGVQAEGDAVMSELNPRSVR